MSDAANTTGGGETNDESSRPARMTFLAVMMVVSAAGNVLLLYAVLHSKKLRQSVHNILIVSLAVVCVCDSLLNMALIMGSLAAPDWGFGDVLCRWHSFLMNLVLVETVLLLTVLASDRYLAVTFVYKYDVLPSPVRLALVIAFTCVQSLAFSIPFLLNIVYTTFRPRLHTCSVSDQTPLAFICVASVLCFLAPAIAITVIFIVIFRLACKHRHEVKTLKTRNHYTDVLMEEPRLSHEMRTAKMICFLFLLWFILVFPYIVTTYIQQYRYSRELSFSVEYPWGVDIALLWMRFSYSAIFPCVVFTWKRELRYSVRECVTCRKHNSVIDMETTVKQPTKPAALREVTAPSAVTKSRDRDQKSDPPTILSFNVPVLFATSDGIHIETPQTDRTDSQLFYTEILSRTQPGQTPVLKGRQLDVGDPEGPDDLPLPADTSDYDSSSEGGGRFAKTLSAWTADDETTLPRTDKGKPAEANHQTAVLQPNQPNRSGEMVEPTVDLAGTQGGDSGIDLSGTAGSSAGKGIYSLVEASKKRAKQERKGYETLTASKSISSRDRHKGTFVLDKRSKREKKGEESPPVLSPSTDVVPLWDNPDTAVGKSEVSENVSAPPGNAEQNSHGQNIPTKAPGRLKPLNTERKRKAKRTGQSKKKKTSSDAATTDQQRLEGAENGMVSQESLNPIVRTTSGTVYSCTHKEVNDETDKDACDDKNTTPASKPKSSNTSRRGHKRTQTSDSQKSLLGSNSSLELQNMKTQNQTTTADGDGGRSRKGFSTEPTDV